MFVKITIIRLPPPFFPGQPLENMGITNQDAANRQQNRRRNPKEGPLGVFFINPVAAFMEFNRGFYRQGVAAGPHIVNNAR